MYIDRLLLGVVMVGLVSGCTTTLVPSQLEAKTEVSAFETYGWGPTPQSTLEDPSTEYRLVDARIRHAVERELEARGYTKATTGQPDFLVAYEVTMQKNPDVASVQAHARDDADPLPLEPTRDSLARQYRQGLLRLYLMEPQGHKLLWQGSARAIISLTTTTQQREERIQEAVHEMLEGFTP